MDKHRATSDVKHTGGGKESPPCAGLASGVLPEVQTVKVANSQTGVSTNNVPLRSDCHSPGNTTNGDTHWYALRTTYGREKKAYDYLVAHGITAFYPTLKSIKLTDGRRTTIEQSRIPNIFFAFGTEEQLKAFVYDNVNLPYLRFYYTRTHTGNRLVHVPLIVPDKQIDSLKIICSSDADDIVVATEEIKKFKEGQTVRVTDGEFKGVTGKVARYKNHQRVGIIINGLLTVCTAYIPSAFIKVIDDKV